MVTLCVREYIPAVMPERTSPQPVPGLLRPVLLQQLHHGGGGSDGAALVVFSRSKDVFPRVAGDVLELLVNADSAPLQIDGLPGQAASLSPAQSGKEHGQIDGLEPVSLNSVHKCSDGLPIQRLDLPAL